MFSTLRVAALFAVGVPVIALGIPSPLHAQLVRDEVRGDKRVCSYFGSDLLPNDTVAQRSVVVGLGQNCPATAPYRDPQAKVPENAALLREETSGTARICIFEQGGVEYSRTVPISVRCAMTPALLEQQVSSAIAERSGQ